MLIYYNVDCFNRWTCELFLLLSRFTKYRDAQSHQRLDDKMVLIPKLLCFYKAFISLTCCIILLQLCEKTFGSIIPTSTRICLLRDVIIVNIFDNYLKSLLVKSVICSLNL